MCTVTIKNNLCTMMVRKYREKKIQVHVGVLG